MGVNSTPSSAQHPTPAGASRDVPVPKRGHEKPGNKQREGKMSNYTTALLRMTPDPSKHLEDMKKHSISPH